MTALLEAKAAAYDILLQEADRGMEVHFQHDRSILIFR